MGTKIPHIFAKKNRGSFYSHALWEFSSGPGAGIYKSTLTEAAEVHPDSPRLAAQQLLANLPRLKL
jgi:hypothetical protein